MDRMESVRGDQEGASELASGASQIRRSFAPVRRPWLFLGKEFYADVWDGYCLVDLQQCVHDVCLVRSFEDALVERVVDCRPSQLGDCLL